jgi:hypothetical protein
MHLHLEFFWKVDVYPGCGALPLHSHPFVTLSTRCCLSIVPPSTIPLSHCPDPRLPQSPTLLIVFSLDRLQPCDIVHLAISHFPTCIKLTLSGNDYHSYKC